MSKRGQAYSITIDKHLTNEEREQLIQQLAGKVDRDSMLFKVMLYTGARASEALALTKDSINHEKKDLYLVGLKDSDDRYIPLNLFSESFYAELVAYAATCTTERLFPIALRTAQESWHKVRPVGKALKSLRHTFALAFYEKCNDIKDVQYAMGHRNINNTMVYVNYLNARQRLSRWAISA